MATTLPRPSATDSAELLNPLRSADVMIMHYPQPPAVDDECSHSWPVAVVDGYQINLIRVSGGWVREFRGIATVHPLPWLSAIREAHESIVSEVYETVWQDG